jgi:uncharacterized protein (DUF58 family)
MSQERIETDRIGIRRRQRLLWLVAGVTPVSGVVLGAPALIPLGVVVGALALAREAWLRRGMRGVEYRREVARVRCVWGDEVGVSVTLWNRSLLPLARVTTEDAITEGTQVRGRETDASPGRSAHAISNVWSLLPFEQAERQFTVVADHRGRVAFGPAHIETFDVFGELSAVGDLPMPAELIVAPRSVPTRRAVQRRRRHPYERPRPGFPEDPSLVAGARAYLPGDPPRRIHWKATARTGIPQSKRYDAAQEREILLVVDIQTVPGSTDSTHYDAELVEQICVTSASLAREALTAGTRCGLAAAAYSYRPQAQVRIQPATGPGQMFAVMDALGRLSPFASGRFETLLAGIGRWLARPTEIVIVTGRDATAYLPTLRRLRSIGNGVRIVAVGPAAEAALSGLRSAGIDVVAARLSPDWRTADALDMAG